MSEKAKLMVNRVLFLLVGALVMFAVMSFTVVTNLRSENTQLTEKLDTSQFEASRLLADAKAQLAAGDYTRAEASLQLLFDNQPGSPESVEGLALLTEVVNTEREADALWLAAMPAIQEQWTATLVAKLRADSDALRAKLEADMDAKILTEWAKAEGALRTTWERDQI